MKLGERSIVLLSMFSFLCACAGGRDNSESGNKGFRIEYLQRIIAINDSEHFKVPMKVSLDSQSPTGYFIPMSLNQAVEYLIDALPEKISAVEGFREIQSCRLTRAIDIDEFSLKCGAQLCIRLPIEDRDSSCTFFTQLTNWIEVAWLSGPCVRANWTSNTRLSSWLKIHGIEECYDMSSLITDAFLIKLSGNQLKNERILELYRARAIE
jgi:hypothetical protein